MPTYPAETPEEEAPDGTFSFRHPWEDEPLDDMPGLPPIFRPGGRAAHAAAATDTAALLLPLAQASASLARLDARLDCASPEVAVGLRARLALREAAGWLAHQHGTWVHPTDLGLREAGLTGSVTAAAMSDRLRRALPATISAAAVAGSAPGAAAEDLAVAQALQFGRLWQRLAEHRTWTPLAISSPCASFCASWAITSRPRTSLRIGSIASLDRRMRSRQRFPPFSWLRRRHRLGWRQSGPTRIGPTGFQPPSVFSQPVSGAGPARHRRYRCRFGRRRRAAWRPWPWQPDRLGLPGSLPLLQKPPRAPARNSLACRLPLVLGPNCVGRPARACPRLWPLPSVRRC